jgi:energy-coupling factor transporter ATP-binding protein EcfA2
MNTTNPSPQNDIYTLFPDRISQPHKQINFVIGTKTENDQKLYLIELDPTFEARVGDLLEAIDSQTGRRYLLMVTDIEFAYAHREEHADMLDTLRRRPDRNMDQATFNALCKNLAVCAFKGEIDGLATVDRGYRPNKYTTTAHRAEEDIERLLITNWQEGFPLGYLRMGTTSRKNMLIHISTTQMVGQRFLIVGQTGKGKSTAVRHMLKGHMQTMLRTQAQRHVGFLVDDFKMEYPFNTQNQRGEIVPGLATSLDQLAMQKLVILTCNPLQYQNHKAHVRDILKLEIPLASLPLSVFCDVSNLTEPQKNVVRLVEDSHRATSEEFFHDILAVDEYGMPDVLIWGKKYGRLFYSKEGRKKAISGIDIDAESDIESGLRERLEYVRRAVQRLLKMPFITSKTDWSCLSKLKKYLREGCIVIVDKSNLIDYYREMLSILLLTHLFQHNQEQANNQTSNASMIPVIVVVEEAQYLLSKDKVADPDSIFAKIAFTGRSYQIGLIAITQRPQAIQKDLLGQFDGYLVLPLEHANDFQHLAEACPALAGYRNDLATAPIGGSILAYGAPKQVISLQIPNYTTHQGRERT